MVFLCSRDRALNVIYQPRSFGRSIFFRSRLQEIIREFAKSQCYAVRRAGPDVQRPRDERGRATMITLRWQATDAKWSVEAVRLWIQFRWLSMRSVRLIALGRESLMKFAVSFSRWRAGSLLSKCASVS
jgi:hypothetical protein